MYFERVLKNVWTLSLNLDVSFQKSNFDFTFSNQSSFNETKRFGTSVMKELNYRVQNTFKNQFGWLYYNLTKKIHYAIKSTRDITNNHPQIYLKNSCFMAIVSTKLRARSKWVSSWIDWAERRTPLAFLIHKPFWITRKVPIEHHLCRPRLSRDSASTRPVRDFPITIHFISLQSLFLVSRLKVSLKIRLITWKMDL